MSKEFEFSEPKDKQPGKEEIARNEALPLLAAAAENKPFAPRKPELPVPPKALDAQAAAPKPQDLGDSFELKTGHKVTSVNETYKIVDTDGNTVSVAASGFSVAGKVKSARFEPNGNAVARFENGTSVVYDPVGRVTVTGKNGDSSSFKVSIPPAAAATTNTFNNMFQNIRR